MNDYTNSDYLESFSNKFCKYLFDSYQGIYSLQDDTQLTSYRNKILAIFIETFKNYFNNL